MLYVPSTGLVVAGDVAYNDVHLYLAESDPQKRREWIAALDKIESLKPRAVIPATSARALMTNPASSRRRASTSAISTKSRGRQQQ